MFLRTTNPNKLEEGDNNIPFEFIRPDMINVRIKDMDILSVTPSVPLDSLRFPLLDVPLISLHYKTFLK